MIVVYFFCKGEMVRDISCQTWQAVLPRVLTDTNSALGLSRFCTSSLLPTKESTIWIDLEQSSHKATGRFVLSSPTVTVLRGKGRARWAPRGAPPVAVQSFRLPRSCKHSKKTPQHFNHCSFYVSCFHLSIGLTSDPVVVQFDCALCIFVAFFVCLFCFCYIYIYILVVSMQVVHMFNAFQ